MEFIEIPPHLIVFIRPASEPKPMTTMTMNRSVLPKLAAGLFLLASLLSSVHAANISFVGFQTDLGSNWRKPSVGIPLDPDPDNIIGSDGYHFVNRPPLWPSYLTSTEILTSTFPGISGYTFIDDPVAMPFLFLTGTMNPNPGTGVSADIFKFTLASPAVGRTIRVTLMVDNLDITAFNAASLTLVQTNGVGASNTVATTAAALNNRIPDWIVFEITGGAAGDVFIVRGVGGTNGTATLGGVAFDSVPTVSPATVFTAQASFTSTEVFSNAWNFTTVAVSGDTMAVGCATSNTVAVLVRNGTNWVRQALLTGDNTESGDEFGRSVAIYGDTLVVGAYGESSPANTVNGIGSLNTAPFSGAAYVFVRTGTNWTQQAYLKPSDNFVGASSWYFGNSVAIFGDTVAIGAAQVRTPVLSTGGSAANGNIGAAYVFRRSGTSWTQQARIVPGNGNSGDSFGHSVALSQDTLVVGAPGEDSSANIINGSESDNSISDSGAAYVFARQNGVWSQQAFLKAANNSVNPNAGGSGDHFGYQVRISGNTIVVGAPWEDSLGQGDNDFGQEEGAAYVFVSSGINWTQQAMLKDPDFGAAYFGFSTSVSGDTVLASGLLATRVFQRSGTIWTLQSSLPGTGFNGSGPESTALSGGLAVLRTDTTSFAIYDAAIGRLLLEDGAGFVLPFGSGSRELAVQNGQPHNLVFTLRNVGTTTLSNIVLSLTGANASSFSIPVPAATAVPVGGSTAFTLRLSPGSGPYPKSATLQIASSDSSQNPYPLALTGYNLLSSADSDADGLNDVAEFRMAAIGFNFQVKQTALVNALNTAVVPGDANSDGKVDQSEFDEVYANYVTNSPWLMMTNVAGLGGTNVTFGLNGSSLGSFTVEYTTDLVDWLPLGLATPRYLFTDTNAPAVPQRHYRLKYP